MKYSLLAFAFIFLISCADDNDNDLIDFTEVNEQEILAYIAENNLDATRSDSGLYYVIDEVGNGNAITTTSDVILIYKGYYTDDFIFDESDNKGFAFNLQQNLITGIIEGVQYFNYGGTGTLLIPSHLAYGSVDNGLVPAGSVLIFDIEVLEDYKEINEFEITEYISENNLNATRSDSGLYYVIDEEGTGTRPTGVSNVTVAYTGYFIDGEVFDESNSSGSSFNLNEVVLGWTEGITYFKEGGNGTLLIPAHLAYGIYGDGGSIPGGAVLIFDVNLISVN